MNPIEFPEVNKTLGKPKGMTDEECGSLKVYNDGAHCVSCWQPSLRERLSTLFFGKVWLSVVSGKTQPPVSIWAARDGFKEI